MRGIPYAAFCAVVAFVYDGNCNRALDTAWDYRDVVGSSVSTTTVAVSKEQNGMYWLCCYDLMNAASRLGCPRLQRFCLAKLRNAFFGSGSSNGNGNGNGNGDGDVDGTVTMTPAMVATAIQIAAQPNMISIAVPCLNYLAATPQEGANAPNASLFLRYLQLQQQQQRRQMQSQETLASSSSNGGIDSGNGTGTGAGAARVLHALGVVVARVLRRTWV